MKLKKFYVDIIDAVVSLRPMGSLVRYSAILSFNVTFIYRHESVVSCLVPLCSVHGKAITTVEGVGSIEIGLHPVQVCWLA